MDWIEEFQHTIEVKKLTVEQSVHSLKQLFKPWPRDEGNSEKVESREKCSAKGDDAGMKPVVPVLTSEEQHGVELADKLLNKAQRAREIQRKLEDPKRIRAKATAVKSSEKNNSITPQTENIHPDLDSNSKNVRKPCTVGCGKRTVQADSQGKSDAGNNSVKSTHVKGLNKLVNVSQHTKTIVNSRTKDITVKDRPNSTGGAKGKVLPAHVKAPFQTNPRLATAKLQTTYRAATSGKSAKGQEGRSANHVIKGGKSAGAIKAGNSQTSSSISGSVASATSTQGTNSSHSSPRSDTSCSNEVKDRSRHVLTEQYGDTNKNVVGDTGQAESDVTDKAEENSTATNTDQDGSRGHDKQLFLLTRDGNTLTLPSNLKKQVHINRKLREKFHTQAVTKKVNTQNTSLDFPAQLQQVYGESVDVETQLQARQAEHVLRVYQNLSLLLDSLHLDKLTEDSPPEDILRTKKLLEYILTTFHGTEGTLHSADFSLLSTAHVCHTNMEGKVPAPAHTSLPVWYNCQGLQGADRHPSIQYKAYQQLESYMSLLYRVQLLHLKIRLIEDAASLVLPLLHSLQSDSSEFIQVLRCAYSLLSTNPNRVPVIVQDTIQDLTVAEGDHEDAYEDDDGG